MSQTNETLGYYVSNMRVRRELIPVYEDDQRVAYRCLTYRADGPEDGDKIVADQVEFDDVLIGMGLMAPRNIVEGLFAKAWRAAGADKWYIHRPVGPEPSETLLRVIN